MKYNPSFDGIRAIALIFVLLVHLSYGVLKGGWIGVDLFFVLSGYLITTLLDNEYTRIGKINLFKFYGRRFLRLYPPVIITIILVGLLWIFSGQNNGLFGAAIAAFFYMSNLLPSQFMGKLAHLWSLAVEEHFYFVWPILMGGLILRLTYLNRLIFVFMLIVCTWALRVYMGGMSSPITFSIFIIDYYTFTLCRIDAILMGAFLALYFSESRIQKIEPKSNLNELLFIGFLFLMILLFLDAANIYWRQGGFVLTNALCLATIFIAAKTPYQPFLSNGILRWIGQRSYGIYVYHYPIFGATEFLRQPNSTANFLLVSFIRIMISIVFAELAFKYIEQPILSKYKNKFSVKSEYIAQ